MSVVFALDTIGPRVSTSGPTSRVQKIAILIQDFFYLIQLRKAHILIKILFKSILFQ
jgi:hypothetical protein